MIRGYPRRPSVRPGERLTLHVSTDAPAFRVEVYRQGPTLAPQGRLGPDRLPGVHVPDGPSDEDWGWPAYELEVPAAWPSGAYVAILLEIDTAGRERRPDVSTADGTDAKALFVVRSAQPGADTPICYKLAWATYHAYNGTGYGSLYAEALWSHREAHPGFKVTIRRPGGGTGGLVMPGDAPDVYDPSSRRQTFTHWDAPFIQWLEGAGYRADYCTDLDIHEDPALLGPYRLLLSVGHDEYWSEAMRDHVEAFIARGGNAAFFSGNICGYRIHFTDGNTAFTCAKVRRSGTEVAGWALDDWQATGRPETELTGTTFRLAGGWWDGRRDTVGYTVQHADHWVYEGTALKDGQVFGDDRGFPLVGYEADGAVYVRKHGVAVATGEGGTPASFVILGLAELGDGWVKSATHGAATMGVYTSVGGGIVFNAATTDWPRLLSRSGQVERISRNVLERLSLRSVRVVGPLPTLGGRMLGVEGETTRFHADAAELAGRERLRYEWRVAGATATAGGESGVEVTMPSPPGLVTVSVTVTDAGAPVAFGTRTVLPLTREERLKTELLTHLREMVMPGEPSNPLVQPTADPASRIGFLYGIRLPWLAERGPRVAELARRIEELRRRGPDAQRP
jgi:hypothetical protein